MFAIKNTLVSDELLQRKFVCNLQACKGACCVEGDGGAPLTEKEALQLEELYDEIKPFMVENGLNAIEEQGVSVKDSDGIPATPLVQNKECAYVVFESDGLASCAIEKAWKAGKIDLQKPISCHLYPVRITEYEGFDAVNYHEWSICKPACQCGSQLGVPVFRFLKEALIRKYGIEWFEEIDAIYNQLYSSR